VRHRSTLHPQCPNQNSGEVVSPRIGTFLSIKRSVALAILSVANIIGTAVGFLLPPFFVDNNASDEKVKSSFAALLLFEFFACLIPLTLVMLWFRESPPTPVSPCSETKHGRYSDEIKALFKNKQFLGLLVSFGCILGSFNINGSLLDNMLDCYGFSSDDVSYFAAAMMICGILSATLVGLYI
jgi:Na+/melibiose symporter-like transporter